MEFHGFHSVGARHYMSITDHGERQVVEVTAKERGVIERSRARAYRVGLQSVLRGWWAYSPPFGWGVYDEAWAQGREAGKRQRCQTGDRP